MLLPGKQQTPDQWRSQFGSAGKTAVRGQLWLPQYATDVILETAGIAVKRNVDVNRTNSRRG
jgi:hypothetical protein